MRCGVCGQDEPTEGRLCAVPGSRGGRRRRSLAQRATAAPLPQCAPAARGYGPVLPPDTAAGVVRVGSAADESLAAVARERRSTLPHAVEVRWHLLGPRCRCYQVCYVLF